MCRPARPWVGQKKAIRFGQVAQLVEQGIENPRVGGSIPSLATTLFPLPASLSAMPHDQHKIDDCIEAIARQGCQYSREVLDGFERDECPPEAAHLSEGECMQVFVELAAVMAVYGDDCPIEDLIRDAGLAES